MLNNTPMHRGKKGVAQGPTIHITFPHATTLPHLHHHIATLHFHIYTIFHHITCDYKRPSTSRRGGSPVKTLEKEHMHVRGVDEYPRISV